MWKQIRRLVLTSGVLLLAVVLLCDVGHVLSVHAPTFPDVPVVSVPQGWSTKRAGKFHTTSQGTMIMPLDWFMAIEQPDVLVLRDPELVHERDYLRRFGFIYESDSPGESEELPIGFAIEQDFRDPHFENKVAARSTGSLAVVGLTCAACHTGQLEYKKHGIRIEGGPGNVDLGLFQSAVGRSLFLTLYVPCRFDRFAERVLARKSGYANKEDLRADFRQFVQSKLHQQLYADKHHLYDLKGGNGRTDALALIGNRMFQDLENPENLAVTSAPVNFPPLWDAPWFDWVQYNASIAPPMVRNIGEALGVGAQVITNPSAGKLYDSTVNVSNLHKIEKWLAGCEPFAGLKSPEWPGQILGPLKTERVSAGAELYASHCKHCHPLVSELRQSYADATNTAWTRSNGEAGSPTYSRSRLIRLPTVNLRQIGTDPGQALNVHKRVVQTPSGVLSEGAALMMVTEEVRKRKYCELQLSPEQIQAYDSHRPTYADLADPDSVRRVIADNLGYRSRPLNGIWATAPYLHNGSVPNLYELLSPVATRSKQFFAGGREFDPDRVGFLTDASHGVFFFDTAVAGNFNRGHEFRDLTLEELERFNDPPAARNRPTGERWATVLGLSKEEFQALSPSELQVLIHARSSAVLGSDHDRLKTPDGVLGAEISDRDRWSLIEYLKSL